MKAKDYEESTIIYGIIEETYTAGDVSRKSFGIAAISNTDGVATVIESVHDISSDRESVEKLASTCTRLQLSPAHLRDVVDDSLADISNIQI